MTLYWRQAPLRITAPNRGVGASRRSRVVGSVVPHGGESGHLGLEATKPYIGLIFSASLQPASPVDRVSASFGENMNNRLSRNAGEQRAIGPAVAYVKRAIYEGDAFTGANRGMITMSIMLANIMQGVDNTILNVALPHIQGSLSASLDQIAWR